jgi:hypothetical protein
MAVRFFFYIVVNDWSHMGNIVAQLTIMNELFTAI